MPKAIKVPASVRRSITNLPTYFDTLGDAVSAALSIFDQANLVLTDIDGCIFCGRDGRASFEIAGSHAYYNFSWYTMPSGRKEFVSYVS